MPDPIVVDEVPEALVDEIFRIAECDLNIYMLLCSFQEDKCCDNSCKEAARYCADAIRAWYEAQWCLKVCFLMPKSIRDKLTETASPVDAVAQRIQQESGVNAALGIDPSASAIPSMTGLARKYNLDILAAERLAKRFEVAAKLLRSEAARLREQRAQAG